MRTVHESVFKPKLMAETKFIVDIRPVNRNAAALSSANATATAAAAAANNNNTLPSPLAVNTTNLGHVGVGVDVGTGAHRGLNGNGVGGGGGGGGGAGNSRNSRAEVNWRRVFTVSSLIVSLLLISGSIYLHLRRKPHLGRLRHEQQQQQHISVAGGVAAALVAPLEDKHLPPTSAFTINNKLTSLKLPYSPALQTQLSATPLSPQSSTIRTLIRSDFTQPIPEESVDFAQTLVVVHANNYNNNDAATITADNNNGHAVLATLTVASTPDAITSATISAPLASARPPSVAATTSGNSFATHNSGAMATTSMVSIDSAPRWNAPSVVTDTRSRHITEACMQCICATATQCRPVTCGNNIEDCGVFRISQPYWLDAGKPALEGDESYASNTTTTYAHCVNNIYCATRTVAAYISRYARDCNGDGVIECRDHIALHLLGPSGCAQSEGELSPIYVRRMADCLAEYE
ncbi:uncharacterized protein LOC118747747 [Rhagoletis pomonella]|uniref:uncharacterized protein LOC118747747 n=1 Tax=Rhagoletis pomonella TaxID=28610 RepID=UPI00177D79E6|nr:uncharacterized protein LOC118747747 [Rhagoletis pomonella]